MGLRSYFRADSRPVATPATSQEPPPLQQSQAAVMSEKQPPPFIRGNEMELQPPAAVRFPSRPQSISGRSYRSSVFVDEIKHEVMVNYLYQQQCSQLWVSDGSGEAEGVLLRKSRGHYMACPPQLGSSPFAIACAALNVQVGISIMSSHDDADQSLVCHDRKLTCH